MSERRIVITVVPRRMHATDRAVPTAVELDSDYYEVDDVIDWINLAVEDPSNVVDFLLADGSTFSMDVDLYDRLEVEEIT